MKGYCARRFPPIGHRINYSAKWYPISLKGIPPRPFIYKTPLTLDIDFDLSRTICCYKENIAAQNDCSNTQPPTATQILYDTSTSTHLASVDKETQTEPFVQVAIHTVEGALSPLSDARRALSRGVSLKEPLVVHTRGSRHLQGYLQLPVPVSGDRTVHMWYTEPWQIKLTKSPNALSSSLKGRPPISKKKMLWPRLHCCNCNRRFAPFLKNN